LAFRLCFRRAWVRASGAGAANTPWAGELVALLAQAEDPECSVLSQSIRLLLKAKGPRLVASNSTDAGQ